MRSTQRSPDLLAGIGSHFLVDRENGGKGRKREAAERERKLIALVDPGGRGAMPPNVQRIFLFCKNRFQDKLADSSRCGNVKRRSASGGGGFAFRPLTRGFASGPC